MLAHKGEHEGVVLAELLAGKSTHGMNYDNIPNATYCHPEVASVGLTEAQCKEKKLDYKVGRFNFSANGRARTSGETEGFVKIIRDAKYGEILGAHIVGAHATEMIHELVVARTNEFTVEEIAHLDSRAPHAVGGGCRGHARFAGEDDPRVTPRRAANRELWIERLGVMDYARALDFQRAVAKARIAGEIPEDVLLLARASAGGDAGPLVEGGASARVAGAARGARRRAVRGRARRRRDVPRTGAARRLSDHRPHAAQERPALVSCARLRNL